MRLPHWWKCRWVETFRSELGGSIVHKCTVCGKERSTNDGLIILMEMNLAIIRHTNNLKMLQIDLDNRTKSLGGEQ